MLEMMNIIIYTYICVCGLMLMITYMQVLKIFVNSDYVIVHLFWVKRDADLATL
jgi:hypothetical protein